MSELRSFYTQLLSISKQRLVETTLPELEKITEQQTLVLLTLIHKLRKIGVIESYLNTYNYDKSVDRNDRIFIGLAHELVIDRLFKSGDVK